MPEEEIHGGLKSRVHTGEGDDAQVACHGQSVDDQEDQEEQDLEVQTVWDSCENKLSDSGEISLSLWKVIWERKEKWLVFKIKLQFKNCIFYDYSYMARVIPGVRFPKIKV